MISPVQEQINKLDEQANNLLKAMQEAKLDPRAVSTLRTEIQKLLCFASCIENGAFVDQVCNPPAR